MLKTNESKGGIYGSPLKNREIDKRSLSILNSPLPELKKNESVKLLKV